jgi:hypothetical protein
LDANCVDLMREPLYHTLHKLCLALLSLSQLCCCRSSSAIARLPS